MSERDPRDAGAYDENGSPIIGGEQEGQRHIVLTSADRITPRPVFWLWTDRMALGTFALLAGREGVGKSTLAYWLAARVTRGELPGDLFGQPKAVFVCATEDSWEHTIRLRLEAAGADLTRVYRVEVVTELGLHADLSLPRDIPSLGRHAAELDAALLLLDPLMSRLGKLDTHRDSEVRLALEPLAALADRSSLCVLGLIHHNKSGSSDPLTLVMGSKAFTAVARSVHTVVPDPEDDTDTRRLFGTPKNNLGRSDLPTLSFTVESHAIDTDEGTAWTGRLEWGEDQSFTIGEAMRRASVDSDTQSMTQEAAEWLGDYMESQGGQVASSDAKRAGRAAGHSERPLRGARLKLRLKVSSEGFPRVTYWELPSEPPASRDTSVVTRLRGEVTTDMTVTTGASRDSHDSHDTSGGQVTTASPLGHKLALLGATKPAERCPLHTIPKPRACLTCEQIELAR